MQLHMSVGTGCNVIGQLCAVRRTLRRRGQVEEMGRPFVAIVDVSLEQEKHLVMKPHQETWRPVDMSVCETQFTEALLVDINQLNPAQPASRP